jgi:hypothetical protein
MSPTSHAPTLSGRPTTLCRDGSMMPSPSTAKWDAGMRKEKKVLTDQKKLFAVRLFRFLDGLRKTQRWQVLVIVRLTIAGERIADIATLACP